MEVYDIIQFFNNPLVGTVGIVGIVGGFATYTVRTVIKNEKKFERNLCKFEENYHGKMSREEIVSMYSKLLTEITPNIIFQKMTRARALEHGLDRQMMRYATEDVCRAITDGATLDIEDPISPHSEIYRSAQKYKRVCQEKIDKNRR